MTTPDEPTAFAAGVATATAEQASEEAGEATAIAESAEATADVALSVAASAESDAWDAKLAVDELRGEMLTRLDAMEGKLAGAGDDGLGDNAAPAPERKDKPEPAAATGKDGEPEKPAESEPKHYGSKGWFGKR